MSLGISSLVLTVTEMINKENKKEEVFKGCNKVIKGNLTHPRSENVATLSSPTYFERRSCSPQSRSVSPVSVKRSSSPPQEEPIKKRKMGGVPMLQSILTQLPLSSLPSTADGNSLDREKEARWPESLPQEIAYMGTEFNQLEALGKLQSLSDPISGSGGAYPGCSSQLASLLSAAAKLKQVAEQAMREYLITVELSVMNSPSLQMVVPSKARQNLVLGSLHSMSHGLVPYARGCTETQQPFARTRPSCILRAQSHSGEEDE